MVVAGEADELLIKHTDFYIFNQCPEVQLVHPTHYFTTSFLIVHHAIP